MKVFVLAPIHNRKETTLKFLRSFSNQTYSDYQMVIIDDGSTDGSSEAIRAEFPETVILEGDGNLWWTGAMRKGVEYVLSIATDNDYILAINDDVTVNDDYIEKLVSASEENGNAIVGSIYRDSENKELVYDSGVKIDWKNYRYYQMPYKKDDNITKNVDTLATRGTIIPIAVFKNIGLFEKKLRHYAADYEYFFRAKKMGYQLLISHDASVYDSENSRTIPDNSRIQSFQNVWRRNFSIKSPNNIYNHLFIIWNYCPSLEYKIKNLFLLVSFNAFLFANSVFLYPFKFLYLKVIK
jgi:GT2 family glycosyltransferase